MIVAPLAFFPVPRIELMPATDVIRNMIRLSSQILQLGVISLKLIFEKIGNFPQGLDSAELADTQNRLKERAFASICI